MFPAYEKRPAISGWPMILNPGRTMRHLAFKSVNGGDFFQSQADIVQSVDQAMFAVLIYVKGLFLSLSVLL